MGKNILNNSGSIGKIRTNRDKQLVKILQPGSVLEEHLLNKIIGEDKIKNDILARLVTSLAGGLNNFVVEPSTNDTFASTSSNNPYGLKFDDLRPRFGIERVLFAGLERIPDADGESYDSAGKMGYYPINAATGKVDKRIRLYGSWTFTFGVTTNNSVNNSVSGDYIVVTDILGGLSITTTFNNTGYGAFSIYVNGIDTTNDQSLVASNVISAQNYSANSVWNLDTGISTVGLNTIKLVKNDANQTPLSGLEIINEAYASSQEISVPAGSEVIKGELVSFDSKVGANALNYKGILNGTLGSELYDGTKGARVSYYRDEDGNYISKVQAVEEEVQAGVVNYNGASSDSIAGLTDSSKYFANSQGNIIRVKDATGTDKLLLVPTAAPSATELTVANDYDGVADTTLFAGNKQFRDDGTTGSTFADSENIEVERYGKVLANADHSNEEVVREIHWREFGAGRTDDFSTLGAAPGGDKAFTLDDGVTTLVGKGVYAHANGYLRVYVSGDWYSLTFIGTGLSQRVQNGTIVNVVSDLPYGVHTFKFDYDNNAYIDGVKIAVASGVYVNLYSVYSFIIYQPKTPKLEGYEPEFAYNVLADQVLTSLPTRSLTAYSGAIDQGSIRKHVSREFVYTTATWNLQAFYSPFGGLPMTYPNTGTDGEAAITIFGSSQFRVLSQHNSTSATLDVLVDGSKVYDFDPANVNVFHFTDVSMTLGSLGMHTIKLERDNTTGYWDFGGIDYHTPIYEPAQWRTNPYLDYLIGSNGLGIYSKDKPVDDKLVARNYRQESTIADTTAVSTGSTGKLDLYPGTVLDPGTYEINYGALLQLSGSNDIQLHIMVDGVESSQVGTTGNDTTKLLIHSTIITLSKRSYVYVQAEDNGGAGTVLYRSPTSWAHPAWMTVRKISEEN